MGISRFGKRYEERVEAARIAAETPTRPKTASDLVTELAEGFEHMERAAAALETGLRRALESAGKQWRGRGNVSLNSNDWYEAKGVEVVDYPVVVDALFQLLGYRITVTTVKGYKWSPEVRGPKQQWFVAEEVLATQTAGVEVFGRWLTCVAQRIQQMLESPPPSAEAALLEDLEGFGVRPWTMREEAEFSEEDAIASIMRTRDGES